MDNTYYIYDPGYGKLLVVTTQIGMVTDEEQLQDFAASEGMVWSIVRGAAFVIWRSAQACERGKEQQISH
jgi:hypothetical protein